jgi:hypothetical protein
MKPANESNRASIALLAAVLLVAGLAVVAVPASAWEPNCPADGGAIHEVCDNVNAWCREGTGDDCIAAHEE